MKNKEIKFPQDIYFQDLKTIGKINFTPREIDVIAFIISGRTTKKIASFLSIAPKTVDNHIHNIMMKLECHSRGNIVDFIEKSGKFSIVRQYYSCLLIKASFKGKLKEISQLVKKVTPSCVIVSCCQQSKQDQYLILERLKRHLKLAGIIATFKSIKQYEGLARSIRERSLTNSFTYLVFNRNSSIDTQKAMSDIGYVEFRESENYYFTVMALVQKMYAPLNLDKIISEFMGDCSLVIDSSDKVNWHTWPKIRKALHKAVTYNRVQHFFKTKGCKFLIFCFSICIFYILFLIFNNNDSHRTMTQFIRSDLIMPFEPTLLDRPDLFYKVEESFKGLHPLKTVALVGIAGAGKTTLARQYARKQKASVIWEINAETKETLTDSLENLAQALAKTEKDQRTLREIQEIKDSKKREDRIFQFVKSHLKTHKDWILIYDNVETFPDFQNYFLPDNGTWGQGKVILTTRDSNIQNMRTIATVISVNELTPPEKSTLFMKILHHGLDQLQLPQKEEVNAFLKFIPPFPLDVSVAAYYIKSTHLTYEKYLKRISEYKKDFINVQENILKGTSDYPKVRYSIITLSLDQLMELCKDFPYLLLFISLIDSQNIPRDLLERDMNEINVDNFIFNLKKYSLITDHSSTTYRWGTTFSVHRSTQAVSLAHLMERLALKPNSPLIQRVIQNLESYIKQPMEREDLFQIRLLTTHYKTFLNHSQLLTEEMKGSLLGDLGGMYLSLGKHGKAKQVLQDALLKLDANDKHQNKSHAKRAQALAYLGNAYGDLGNYEEAKDFLEQSLLIYKKHLPTNHKGVAWALTYLGNVYRDLGNSEKAKELLEQSLYVYKTYLPENYAESARASVYLGIVCTILGDYEKAKNILEQSLYIYRTHLSKNHVGVAWVLAHLGNAYGELGNHEKAKNLLEQSIALYKEHFPEDHIKVGWALSYLGDIYRITGKYEKAKNALEQSIIIYKKHLPENHIVIAGILVYLSDVHKDLGEYEKAKQLLEQSLIIYEKDFPENHPETAWALAHLGDVCRIMGNFEEAQSLLEKSLTIYRQHFSEDHNEIIWALERLEYTHNKVSDYKKDQTKGSKI